MVPVFLLQKVSIRNGEPQDSAGLPHGPAGESCRCGARWARTGYTAAYVCKLIVLVFSLAVADNSVRAVIAAGSAKIGSAPDLVVPISRTRLAEVIGLATSAPCRARAQVCVVFDRPWQHDGGRQALGQLTLKATTNRVCIAVPRPTLQRAGLLRLPPSTRFDRMPSQAITEVA
jgi:hypothetical protein